MKTLSYYKKLYKNKHLEIEVRKESYWFYYFNFTVSWSRKIDHAGVGFEILVGPYSFDFNIYDDRHWNYDADRWMTLEEQANESYN